MKNLLLFNLLLWAVIILSGCTNSQKDEKKPNVIVFHNQHILLQYPRLHYRLHVPASDNVK